MGGPWRSRPAALATSSVSWPSTRIALSPPMRSSMRLWAESPPRTATFTGLLSGTYAGTERDVVDANGTATFHGSGTFTGSFAGRSGTATYRYEGVYPLSGVVPTSGPGSAKWVLLGATGGLESVQASGTFGLVFLGVSGTCDAGIYGGSYLGQAITAA